MLLLLTQIEPALAVRSEIIQIVSREREFPSLIAGFGGLDVSVLSSGARVCGLKNG